MTLLKKDAYIIAAVLLESSPIRPVSVRESTLLLYANNLQKDFFMDSSTVVLILLAVYAVAEFVRNYGLLLLAVGLIATLTIAWRRHA